MEFFLEEVETHEKILSAPMNFSVTTINNSQIKITWKHIPAAMIENYIIERSVGDSNDFISLGEFPAGGSSRQYAYEFIDQHLKRNTLYNYRLRCVNSEGYEFSETKTAMITGKNIIRNVTANPAEGYLRWLADGYSGTAEFSLFNPGGENVFFVTQNIRDYSTILINIGVQPKGIYVMQVKTEVGVILEKINIR